MTVANLPLIASDRPLRSTCPYCGVGCGVLVEQNSAGKSSLRGDPDHPANAGRLCGKGRHLLETLGLDQRQLQPQLASQDVSWATATAAVAKGFNRVIKDHGPEAVAFYVSGQLLTEDYYLANKLMKGFIGSNNIDTNSRLCMSSAVAAHQRAYGADLVLPSYSDIDQADLVVLTGSNLAWCHPVLYQRLLAAREARGARTIVIDPRRTASCDGAALHLPLAPGTDVLLWSGLLVYLADHQGLDQDFISKRSNNFANTLAAARAMAPDPAVVAAGCQLPMADVLSFYAAFAGTPRSLTLFSMGVNQSSHGVDNASSILHCHLAAGHSGQTGAGAFSITGQPNAMGGREVGGLASALAAHLDPANPDHRSALAGFWGAKAISAQPGRKAVDLFRALADGQIKALWVMGTNPVVSMPDADRVRAALAACDLLVVSDCYRNTDTMDLAHIRLPAAPWGEKDGTVTNSERRISRQRAFLPLAGNARPDWQIINDVAAAMGHSKAFSFTSSAQVFQEHARLSQLAGTLGRPFDLSPLAKLSEQDYDNLEPVQWALPPGLFATADKKAQFTPLGPSQPQHPAEPGCWPLVLNTGRSRDQWHTMTRSARTPTLVRHMVEPALAMHPADISQQHLTAGNLVQVASAWGAAVLRLQADPGQRRGEVFASMHWTGQYSSHGRIDAVVNPAVDPLSGQPEFKHTPVRVTAWAAAWHGFALTSTSWQPPTQLWWARVPGSRGWRTELAGSSPPEQLFTAVSGLFGAAPAAHSSSPDGQRCAIWAQQRQTGWQMQAVLLLAPSAAALPPRDWLADRFATAEIAAEDISTLLAGAPLDPASDPGPMVCSCRGVGRNQITKAIRCGQLTDVAAIGQATNAGITCGSCRPELASLLAACAEISSKNTNQERQHVAQ